MFVLTFFSIVFYRKEDLTLWVIFFISFLILYKKIFFIHPFTHVQLNKNLSFLGKAINRDNFKAQSIEISQHPVMLREPVDLTVIIPTDIHKPCTVKNISESND